MMSSLPLKRWWMFLRPVTRGRVAVWWLRWKLRGHDRNHDPFFCHHPTKAWLWEMEDGCKGLVCDWCHLLEPWTPTSLPDVAMLLRTTPDGRPDPDWSPQRVVERYCEAWERLEKDLVRMRSYDDLTVVTGAEVEQIAGERRRNEP